MSVCHAHIGSEAGHSASSAQPPLPWQPRLVVNLPCLAPRLEAVEPCLQPKLSARRRRRAKEPCLHVDKEPCLLEVLEPCLPLVIHAEARP